MKRAFMSVLFAVIFGLMAPLPALAVGEIATGQLANGVFAASAAGRLKMATNFFDAATVLDKIANDAITAAVVEAKFAAGAISATVDGRAAIAANYFDAATLANKVAADSITSAFWDASAAVGAIGATVDGRASLANNFFDQPTIASKISDDAFTTAEFAAAGGGKFAPGALDEAGVDNLFADASIDAEDFVAGAGGIFAPNCMDATALTNVVAADAFTAAVFEAKFAAGAVSATVDGRAALADDYFTTAEFIAGVGGKFAPSCMDATALANVVAADAITAAVWEAKAAAGAISATVDGRASLAANFFDAATLTDKIAADAITAGVWEAKAAAGAISATVDGRASLADGFFDTASLGLKIVDDAITTTVINDEIVNSAFTTAHFSGAEIKFAAGALDEAGVDSLFADDSINAEDFVAGPGGIFASDCLDATAVGNVFAADSWSSANVAAKVAAGAIGEAKLEGAAYAANTTISTPTYLISRQFAPGNFANAPGGGDVDDQEVLIFNANSPSFYLVDAWLALDVAEGAPETMYLSTADDGATRISGSIADNAVGRASEGAALPAAATRAVALNSSVWLYCADPVGLATGTLYMMVRANQ